MREEIAQMSDVEEDFVTRVSNTTSRKKKKQKGKRKKKKKKKIETLVSNRTAPI